MLLKDLPNRQAKFGHGFPHPFIRTRNIGYMPLSSITVDPPKDETNRSKRSDPMDVGSDRRKFRAAFITDDNGGRKKLLESRSEATMVMVRLRQYDFFRFVRLNVISAD